MARATQLKETFDQGAMPPSDPITGNAVVTVYCKHNPGIVLRAGIMVPATEPSPTGLRDVPGGVFRPTKSFRVAGPARPVGGDARAPVVAGYAVTHGVPKDLWDAWYESFKDSDMVRNRIIFANESESYGNGQAHEQRGVTTGLEPLNQGKDLRTKAVTQKTSMMTGVEPLVRSE